MADAVVFSPLGDYIFVATQGTNTVEVFDAYNNRLMTGAPTVGRAPQGLALSADGTRLYVQNFMSRSVAVYDVGGIVNSTTNTFQHLTTISTMLTELLPPQVLQGKQIFYNADDRRMNLDGYISCASCHLDGDTDGQVWDFTDRGEGLRNTVMLQGRGGMLHGPVHWTGNFDEIQDFEHDIRGSFGGTGFMTDAQFNTGTRNTPLGDRKAGVSADLDALAAYVSSLTSVARSPFRNTDGSLTADGQAGRLIFNQLQCYSCHAGPQFTDSSSGFLHNVGTIKPSSGRRLGQPLTGLDTPTLKGIWETGPYLHDGSAATPLDVLTTANPNGTHGNVAALNTTQRQQLIAYLQQIDEREAANPPSLLFMAQLSGAQEVPATSSTATGRAKVVLGPDGTTVLVSLQFSGLSSSQTAAHIHGPAAAGSNAPALITLPNGTLTNHVVTLTAEQVQWLRSGQLYLNVHSANFPNGEIRGQLSSEPPSTPSTVTLVARHSGKCLDVAGQSSADGAIVQQFSCSGGANQQWQFRDVGGGYFNLINRNSGKCLDVNGAATTDGAQIIQWACHSGTNQQWLRR